MSESTSAAGPSRGILVTGASRGVGAAVARAFAERGDRVVVHHRGPSSLDRAAAVLEGLPGSGHVRLAADLSDRLETRVRIALGQRKGRLTVEFASVDDLNRILDAMHLRHPRD